MSKQAKKQAKKQAEKQAKIEQEKPTICPVMAAGFISGYVVLNGNNVNEINSLNIFNMLPKCVKNKCRCYKDTTFTDSSGKYESGQCGLANFNLDEHVQQMF